MNSFKNKITVLYFKRNSRNISIDWTMDGVKYETAIYKHLDGTWHLDPETSALGEELLSELRKACRRYDKRKKSPYRNIRVWFAD